MGLGSVVAKCPRPRLSAADGPTSPPKISPSKKARLSWISQDTYSTTTPQIKTVRHLKNHSCPLTRSSAKTTLPTTSSFPGFSTFGKPGQGPHAKTDVVEEDFVGFTSLPEFSTSISSSHVWAKIQLTRAARSLTGVHQFFPRGDVVSAGVTGRHTDPTFTCLQWRDFIEITRRSRGAEQRSHIGWCLNSVLPGHWSLDVKR